MKRERCRSQLCVLTRDSKVSYPALLLRSPLEARVFISIVFAFTTFDLEWKRVSRATPANWVSESQLGTVRGNAYGRMQRPSSTAVETIRICLI